MPSLNKVMIIGNICADPDLRYTQSGQPVTNMRVATNESYTDKQGQKVEQAEFHSVVVWGRQAEPCANYLHRGSLAYVEGKLQTRKWQDQQGNDRYSTEINAQRVQFLDSRGQQQGQASAQQPQRQTAEPPRQSPDPEFPTSADELGDVPF